MKNVRNQDLELRRQLASELKILIHLGSHLNVVSLLGAKKSHPRRSDGHSRILRLRKLA
jgi:hypothetical protein